MVFYTSCMTSRAICERFRHLVKFYHSHEKLPTESFLQEFCNIVL